MRHQIYNLVRRNYKVVVLCMCLHQQSIAQSTLTLPDLYQALTIYHPYRQLQESVIKIETNQKKINALGALPQTNFQGQGTWQSAVTEIPQVIPGLEFPSQAHDQYRAILEVSQSIYDGGVRRAQDMQAQRISELETANTDVLFFNLRENICRSYYNAIVAELTSKQLELLAKDLDQKANRLNNQIKEGVVSGYQQAAIQIKIKETQQSISEAKRQKLNAFRTLELLTGMKLDTSIQLTAHADILLQKESKRPELRVLDAQKNMQTSQFQLSLTRYQPKVQIFGQLGYGRPGLNLLSNDFEPYSILGLRWQWNLSNLYSKQSTREKDMLQANLSKIKTQEDAFIVQQNIKEQAQLLEIENLNRLIQEDDLMIALHERVVKSSEAQFENGVITINEYATDTYNLTQAKIKKDMHQTLLSQSKELLKLIYGTN